MLKTASFAQYSGTQALLSTRLEMCLEYIDYPGSEKSKYKQYNKDFGVQQSGSDESVLSTPVLHPAERVPKLHFCHNSRSKS